jgi:lysophospholipase L1-like esterase
MPDATFAVKLRHMKRIGSMLIAIAAMWTIAAPAHACPPPTSYYLAVGDSIPFGFTRALAESGASASAYDDNFATLVAERLGQRLVNYSCPGESTVSYLSPCIWRATGHPLHDTYTGAQRDAALAFLQAHRGHVALITVSLNGNDANAYLATCPAGDISCLTAGAPAAIAAYATRLLRILRELRAAAPQATIVVTGAYDPNIAAFAAADPLFAALNVAAAQSASAARARYADPMPVFNPPGDEETAAICTLTLACTASDPHPSAAGQAALAKLILAAARPADIDTPERCTSPEKCSRQ